MVIKCHFWSVFVILANLKHITEELLDFFNFYAPESQAILRRYDTLTLSLIF